MRFLVILALAVGAAAGLVACDDAESVVVENNTSRVVVVYEDGVATELISPGISKSFETLRFRGTLTFQVRYFCEEEECDQGVLSERTFTWEEMHHSGGVKLAVEPLALGEH